VPVKFELMLANIFLVTACVLAVVGFGVGVIIYQLGFDHVAERSELVAGRLRVLLDRMSRRHGEWNHEMVRQSVAECGEIIVDEQNAWFRQTAKIAIHL